MRLRPRMRSLAGLSLLVAVQSHAETYISCPGWFQDWYLRDASEPIATIRATVDFVNLNQGSYYGVYPADNDWNVFLKPDVGRYAINSFGDKNQAMESDGHRIRRGRIEGEVLALPRPMWFRDRFPPGTRVRAQGWWTMDSGHDDKTELHPLEWIMSIQENPFQLFAAVDESGRFNAADNGQFDTWAFVAPLSNEQVSPGQLSPGLTHIFAETAEVGSGGTARLRQTPGLINLDVELEPQPFLGPPHMGCGDSAGLSITHGSTYLAELSYATAPLLSDQVSFSIVTEQGKKFGKFRVVATLADPPLGTLRYSEWQHTRVFGFDPLTEVVRTSPQSHGVDVTWDYRPAEGSDERSFDLYVMGSTHAKNAWLTGDYRRIFVQANGGTPSRHQQFHSIDPKRRPTQSDARSTSRTPSSSPTFFLMFE